MYKDKLGRIVNVRLAEEKDGAALVEYMDIIGTESDFLSFGAEGPGVTVEQECEFLKGLRGKRAFMLVYEIEGEVAGLTNITVRENRPRLIHFGILGISCLKKYWGIGLGDIMMKTTLEEAKNRGLMKINLEVNTTNARAIKLYEKFGFEIEGTILKNTIIDGEYHDCHMMGKEL